MKSYIILFALILFQLIGNKLFAQKCLIYRYDADGNRIKKTLSHNCGMQRDVELMQELVPVDELSVYPNPTDGVLRIILPETVKHEMSYYKLYDLNGTLLIGNKLYEHEAVLNIESYPSGVYLLKIKNGEDEISKIILKQ